MSTKTAKPLTDDTFTGKLDVSMVSPQQFVNLLNLHADTPRTVVTVIGLPGLGKTAIPKQVAAERGAEYMQIHVPTVLIEDLGIPTTAADPKDRAYYDKRISRKFQPILKYVEDIKKANGGKVPPGKNPILVVEELNRASDKHVTKAIFTLLEDRCIGDVHLDPSIQIVVTMNPSGGSFQTNEFEKDPAHRRRLMMVGLTHSPGDFLHYARKNSFHPEVIRYLESTPKELYDTGALEAGKKFPCPSSWETVSQSAYAFEKQNLQLTDDLALVSFAGTIGHRAAEAFRDYVVNNAILVAPEDILTDYTEKGKTRKRVLSMIDQARMDKLTTLTASVALKAYDENIKPAVLAKNLAAFMDDLPVDVFNTFIKEFVDLAKTANNGVARRTEINHKLVEHEGYINALKKMNAAKEKVDAAAKAEGLRT